MIACVLLPFSSHQLHEQQVHRNQKNTLHVLSKEQKVQECDARDDDSSNAAGFIKK
jgi:hypothetical protein